MRAADALDLPGGILVANPLPESAQLDPALHDRLLAEALEAAEAGSVRGKDITPFLLEYIHEHTGRASVAVNLDIVRGNCRLGADIARAWAARRGLGDAASGVWPATRVAGRSGGTQTMPSENPAEPIPNAALKRLRLTAVSSAVISTSCASVKCSLIRANSSSVTSTGVRMTATV